MTTWDICLPSEESVNRINYRGGDVVKWNIGSVKHGGELIIGNGSIIIGNVSQGSLGPSQGTSGLFTV